ncbi:MAG: lysozyme [Pseudomonadota bacterium]
MREITLAGIELVQKYEGYHKELPDGSCVAYLDTLAKPEIWTIGWGCTRGVGEGDVWSRETAESELGRELALHERRVNQLVTVPLSQSHFDALVSFDYNTGGLTLKGGGPSTLLRKLNKRDYEGAEQEFGRWIYAGGKTYRGLVRRRKEEAALFARGTLALFDDPAEDDPMTYAADAGHQPQSVQEASAPITRTQVALAAAPPAAGAGATAATYIPPGSGQAALTIMSAMGAYAQSSPAVVGIILATCLGLWFLPRFVRS